MSLEAESELSQKELADIERKYDTETAFRATGPGMGAMVTVILVAMTLYHYLQAGYFNIREFLHFGIHLAFVLCLTFLLFGFRRSDGQLSPKAWYRLSGVPIWDIAFAIIAVAAALYLPLVPTEVAAHRAGAPNSTDVFMGTVLIVFTLEAARRSIGPTLPIIALIFIGYALFSSHLPGILKLPSKSWPSVIDSLYSSAGIYGDALGAMARYVFLFVLFGVLATRIGLGQLFIDFAMVLAGRYSGGPAKVAIFSSALMGTISGSSIANTVTTGALTIPMMKRIGYKPHFAAAVEATSSTGGQITPPVMGAAAFIMVDYLNLPLRTILLAALFPALLHYFAILMMVHLEAKKLGLQGIAKENLPRAMQVLKAGWLTLIPLGILLYLIFTGKSPDYAAVWSINACVLVGIANHFIRPDNSLTLRNFVDALSVGAKNAIAVGAAAAAVGIVVGVVTSTGIGFKLANMVVQSALELGASVSSIWPFSFFSLQEWTLFFSLVFIAITCVIMGAGIPTTATYVILVAVAAPALASQLLGELKVQDLVAHFFVFYYGVLADITPPVALAAYAAAGIAGSNPFKTGNTAFRLGIAKALVPFVFVYSPSLLIVADGYTFESFIITLIGTMLGITGLGVAFTRYFIAPMRTWECWYVALASLFLIAPGVKTMIIGLVLLAPMLYMQWQRSKALNIATDAASES